MPRFDQPSMDDHALTGTGYGFSAARIADLGASEYTLVALAADRSSSVSRFAREIEHCVAEIVRSCSASPRAENLMLRFVTFNETVHEVHGFKPLSACPPADYDGSIRAGGATALCDAALNCAASLEAYGGQLDGHDFDVNAILFVVTDGEENSSQATAKELKQRLAKMKKRPEMSSLVSVLVGAGVGTQELSRALQRFKKAAGLDRYIQLERADAKSLAKLAKFVSRSISLQSQSLASGIPSNNVVGF